MNEDRIVIGVIVMFAIVIAVLTVLVVYERYVRGLML